ncbi:bifunctional glycosyltransferase/CDP-glycerol:glycerophosphate glycerophosphotransferase [Streptomyces gobiensis]|uniref:bifunctional glycosyltransferase/CDP-glycerol:glycerophosphate glycerophosphotransferase n=1 Tax=Streptomyces gobiensis TaxID=2875706 RepID=UPI001E572255|nr:CDP-glycerol glycerophosphotransferase family protein [Streptomyces gobiensis]UGY91731.1 bifunctional glycosyltransferase family 2 protein/CDP-glycerol:glycerophosphate glycerophosphotransferase [Streptomyces gobiensis]
MPDISVIVIVYNDADRLPTAVRSVLGQTLRDVEVLIVDDCSTDGSYETAQRLADAHPDRVRAFRLPENSGSGGAPRNLGIAEARGRYVMFLDSDDELDRNACRNMIAAAERTGADFVSGLCVRVHLDGRNRKTVEWYPWLYGRSRTIDSVSELPDLLVWDTLSTNKCYRRDFLREHDLQFPVGILYEDLLFSAEAYAAARRIALIPHRVYYWSVVEKAAKKSVTNSRHEIDNFIDRMEIHRRIDALLAERGLDELKFHKDVKFLKHDLVLHLWDLPFRDAGYRQEFARIANSYLSGISAEAYGEVQPFQAICAYLLSKEDWDNLMPAVDTLTNRDKLSSPLVERDGRVYWCGEHLDDAEGLRTLDVTDMGYHTRSLGDLFLRNRLTSYGDDGRGTVRLAGSIVNPLGRIASGARIRGRLEFRARRRSLQTFHFPLTSLRCAGRTIDWDAEVDLARALRPLGVIDVVWDVRLILDVDGETTRTRLSVEAADLDKARALSVRPRLTRLVADRIEPDVSKRGHLTFVLRSEGQAAVRAQTLVGNALRSRAGVLAKTALRRARKAKGKLNSDVTKIRVYHEVFSKLPIRKGLVVFESHLGKQYSDSPRAIYEEMRRRGIEFEAVWSYAGKKPAQGFPEDATLVRRWGWEYLKALAQAEFWIDNQGFPLKLAKRPETTYIQTWHGTALKRMGFDEPRLRKWNRGQQEEFQRVLDRFDHFLVRSEHDARTLAKGFRLRDEVLLRTGYPRNDALVAAHRQETETGSRERGPLAAELGVPEDRTVLLYAPTFRAAASGKVRGFELPFDVEKFAERFGDRYVLLIRSHYLNNVVLPPSVRGKVINVSGQYDISPVLALADGLITDYSSVMFDYALLDRPMVFFTYDYEEYANESRGTYFDLRDQAPGPVVATEEELFSAVDDLKAADTEYGTARRQFAARYGEYDQGDAARTIVEKFFAPRRDK